MGRKTADGRRALRTGEYQRKSGTFEYKHKDADGRIISISAKTLDELREKEAEALKDRADGIRSSGRRDTLNDWFKVWEQSKAGLKSNTASNYVYMYGLLVRDTLGRRRIIDIKNHDIRLFYKQLLERPTRSGKPMAVRTIEVIQNVLHQVFDLAYKADIIRRNPTDGALAEIKRASGPAQKREALTPEEQARFLSCIRGTKWEPVFGFLLETGLRIGEAAGLTWDDIDEAAGVIHIRRTMIYYPERAGGKCTTRINTPKTEAGTREIPFNSEIQRLLDLQRERGYVCRETVDGISGFIFGTRQGSPVNQNSLNRAIKRIIAAANEEATDAAQRASEAPPLPMLPAFSCHVLRHTYATNAIRAGVDLPSLMGIMGHRDMRITLEIYTSIQRDMKREADAKRRAYVANFADCEVCEEICEEITRESAPVNERQAINPRRIGENQG